MMKLVLVLNAGSSSLKFAVVDAASGTRALEGLAERLGTSGARLIVKGSSEPRGLDADDHEAALGAVLGLLEERGLTGELVAVGHRVVHGGERFPGAALLDDEAVEAITALAHLAPLHNPVNLAGIRAARAAFPQLPQVAVFDTAFHQTLPEHVYRYAIPEAWYTEHGARRYGFHGTSHAYVAAEVARRMGRPLGELELLTAHLGNGSSATAISRGESRDTTMGLTPLAGLVMGTRSGDVDPALVLYMARRLPGGLDAVDEGLHRHSGLLGLSGRSNDVRELSAFAGNGDARATLALEVFCYRLATALLGLCAALPKLDALVFTGGIGENSREVRAQVVERLGLLGLRLDVEKNRHHGAASEGRLDAGGGPQIWVIPTDEERRIASETWDLSQRRP